MERRHIGEFDLELTPEFLDKVREAYDIAEDEYVSDAHIVKFFHYVTTVALNNDTVEKQC